MMTTHSARETEDDERDRHNEQRCEYRVMNEEAEADRRHDGENRRNAEAAESGDGRADDACLVEMISCGHGLLRAARKFVGVFEA